VSSRRDTHLVVDAAAFAADRHRDQRRKDVHATPYINHPLTLAHVLMAEGDVDDVETIVAAILHDTIEDTKTTRAEIAERFGEEIASVVVEVTDDQSLGKQQRKDLQVEHAPHLSRRAKAVKLADKIANVSDIDGAPPAGWSLERKREYFDWAKRVVDEMCGVNQKLDARFDA
jgi:guanosine-3',5'-bis(diphosphate) 3'-pyrophosphohydrolase